MKLFGFCMLIFTAMLNFSCGQNVESLPIAANEIIVETTPQIEPTPNKYKEIDIIEKFSRMGEGNQPNALEFKDYKIKTVTVKKKDDAGSPEADIYDAVLSKNGKTIARFEGIYYPLGNFMSFGFYQFLNRSGKQLFIIEESNRYDHAWIVSLEPEFEVIFDAADYDLLYGSLDVIDIDNDGEKEIALSKNCNLGFTFSNIDQPWVRIIFKYDSKTQKYVPASHIFTDFTLKEQEELMRKFNESKVKRFSDGLEIMMTYFYAGNEEEAWRIFNENEIDFTPTGVVRATAQSREKIKQQIMNALNKDPIYKFISNDLSKQ